MTKNIDFLPLKYNNRDGKPALYTENGNVEISAKEGSFNGKEKY